MSKILYIGIYSDGQTSKMRADIIKDILVGWNVEIINTDIPTKSSKHIWQSIGFRYKIGPLIKKVNNYILANLNQEHYDLIWVDKAIYIKRGTTQILRNHTEVLVHYTPDPAFAFHKSKLFYSSMRLYDYVITTKSYEMDDYSRAMGDDDKVIYVTQGFDKQTHRPLVDWEDKKGVAFIGHYEKGREEPIEALLDAGIDVTLAGINWSEFAKSHNCDNLHYLGAGVFGEDYVNAISSCLFALGSVSKWIPEKHTTRTFEIPAIKTALLTERNDELVGLFTDDEVIFYKDVNDLVCKVKYYLNHTDSLKKIVEAGYNKVISAGYDYESIIRKVINKIINYETDQEH